MARFLAPEAFSAATETISLLPFNFERTGTHQYLVANMVGDFIRLTEDEINKLIDLRVTPGDGLYEKAYSAHLITGSNQQAQRQLLALRLRSRMSFLQQATPLHIFVVTWTKLVTPNLSDEVLEDTCEQRAFPIARRARLKSAPPI